MPVAIGAAVACPDRKVLCITGDGAGLYMPQALWTMARENLDVVMQVVSTTASGYQSAVTELADQGQQAFQRNFDAFSQALRVRTTTDLLNIQTRYLHDSLGAVLNTSARISEISAETAAEAAGKLQQRQSA